MITFNVIGDKIDETPISSRDKVVFAGFRRLGTGNFSCIPSPSGGFLGLLGTLLLAMLADWQVVSNSQQRHWQIL